jgi:hypothetical protein
MVVDGDYEDEAATFAYMGLQVPTTILFDQIEGFTFFPIEGVNLPPITSVAEFVLSYKGSRSISPWEISIGLSNTAKE